MAAKTRWEPIAILYDRMTPEAQQCLIDRFVQQDLDRLVELTALRSKLDKKKLEIRD
jgi:hypothetical protein